MYICMHVFDKNAGFRRSEEMLHAESNSSNYYGVKGGGVFILI